MSARDVMNPQPTVLSNTDTIAKATEYMMANRYRSLPVVDDKGCFLGMFGVQRLLRLLLPSAVTREKDLNAVPFACSSPEEMYERLQEYKDLPVSDFLEHPAIVNPDTALLEALLIIHNSNNSLPVVDKNTNGLVGVISYWDIGKNVLKAGNG